MLRLYGPYDVHVNACLTATGQQPIMLLGIEKRQIPAKPRQGRKAATVSGFLWALLLPDVQRPGYSSGLFMPDMPQSPAAQAGEYPLGSRVQPVLASSASEPHWLHVRME